MRKATPGRPERTGPLWPAQQTRAVPIAIRPGKTIRHCEQRSLGYRVRLPQNASGFSATGRSFAFTISSKVETVVCAAYVTPAFGFSMKTAPAATKTAAVVTIAIVRIDGSSGVIPMRREPPVGRETQPGEDRFKQSCAAAHTRGA